MDEGQDRRSSHHRPNSASRAEGVLQYRVDGNKGREACRPGMERTYQRGNITTPPGAKEQGEKPQGRNSEGTLEELHASLVDAISLVGTIYIRR